VDALNAKKSTSDKLAVGYNQTSTMNDTMTEARQLLQNAPVDILSTYKNIDQLKKAFNGQYAKLAQDLDMIEKAFPGVTIFGQTKDSALSTLNGANSKMLNAYYKLFNQFTGGVNTQGTPVNSAQQLPQQIASPQSLPPIPQGIKFGGGDFPSLNNLPAIQ